MLKVAIIDDSDDVRQLWRTVLDRSVDFEVCADGGDGLLAVDIAKRLRPDVMLLDLSMPGMGGLEALPLVLAESPGTQVVVLSGFRRREFSDRVFALGACGFLEKHLPVESLSQRLMDLLRVPDAPGAR